MLLKFALLIAVAVIVGFLLLQQEKKRSRLRDVIVTLDLHRARGLNDMAVSLFCGRLGKGETNVAALTEIVGLARNHVIALEGQPSGRKYEAAITKGFFKDATRLYRISTDGALLLDGLKGYMYGEKLSSAESDDLNEIIAELEAAFDGRAQ